MVRVPLAIRLLYLLLGVVLGVAGVFALAAQNAPTAEEPRYVPIYTVYPTRQARIVMFGDSLVYGAAWQELLARPDVVGRGVHGDTTGDALARLDDVLALKPEVCVTMLGVNDAHRPAIDDATALANYTAILDTLRDHGVTPIVMLTLPVASHSQYAATANPRVAILNAGLRAYCERHGVLCLDLAPRLTDADYKADGAHVLPDAYAAWAEMLAPHLPTVAGTTPP